MIKKSKTSSHKNVIEDGLREELKKSEDDESNKNELTKKEKEEAKF